MEAWVLPAKLHIKLIILTFGSLDCEQSLLFGKVCCVSPTQHTNISSSLIFF